MNHTAARRFAVGSGAVVLLGAAVVAATTGPGAGLGWGLLGWSITALTGVVGGAWTTLRVGSAGAGFLVALATTMLVRLFVSAAGAAAAASAGDAAFWPFVGGLLAGFLPLQVYEIGWFYRLGRRLS